MTSRWQELKKEHLPDTWRFFSIAEVAYILGVSRRLVSQWISDGVLPAVRLGPGQRLVRIRADDLNAFVEKYRTGEIPVPTKRDEDGRKEQGGEA